MVGSKDDMHDYGLDLVGGGMIGSGSILEAVKGDLVGRAVVIA